MLIIRSYVTVKRFYYPTFIITLRNFIEFNQPLVCQTEFMKRSTNYPYVPFRDARREIIKNITHPRAICLERLT